MSPRRIVLAPMEGVADALMRRVLTRIGGYDWCVSEFARVTATPLSLRRLLALCPELAAGAETVAGTPLRVQLLGSDPGRMGESAALAASRSPYGIDLNFGCPAPTVNRHRGGAALLDEPELLHAIAAAVRSALPAGVPLSAKMRLGIDDAQQALACAQALQAGGVDELTVHARTRADGYVRPARWEWIARIRAGVAIPVIANGDVCSVADWHACRAITGCDAVMLGRGALADPFLARRLRGEAASADWAAVLPSVIDYWRLIREHMDARQVPGRLKQWLTMLRRQHPQAATLFGEVRGQRDIAAIGAILLRHAGAAGVELGAPAAAGAAC